MATIAELKKEAATAADEAVEYAAKIREICTDNETVENAENLESRAIEKATEAEEAEKKADVETAKEEAVNAANDLKELFNSIKSANEKAEEQAKGEEAAEEEENKVETAEGEDENGTAEIKNYIYIGPSIKQFDIKENTIYRGTKADVYEHLKEAINAKPLIKNFIFEAAEAAEAKTRTKTKGNALYNMYSELKK